MTGGETETQGGRHLPKVTVDRVQASCVPFLGTTRFPHHHTYHPPRPGVQRPPLGYLVTRALVGIVSPTGSQCPGHFDNNNMLERQDTPRTKPPESWSPWRPEVTRQAGWRAKYKGEILPQFPPVQCPIHHSTQVLKDVSPSPGERGPRLVQRPVQQHVVGGKQS